MKSGGGTEQSGKGWGNLGEKNKLNPFNSQWRVRLQVGPNDMKQRA